MQLTNDVITQLTDATFNTNGASISNSSMYVPSHSLSYTTLNPVNQNSLCVQDKFKDLDERIEKIEGKTAYIDQIHYLMGEVSRLQEDIFKMRSLIELQSASIERLCKLIKTN